MSYLTRTVRSLCKRHGIAVRTLPGEDLLELCFPDGRVRHVEPQRLDLNGDAASDLSRIKPWGLHFLREAGIRVPEFDYFFRNDRAQRLGSQRNEAAAVRYAATLGFPVVLKPATKSRGQGVVLANSEEEVRALLPSVLALDRMIMVQRFVAGEETRLVVLDDEVCLAIRKVPFTVTGDGRRSIDDLMIDRLAEVASKGIEVPQSASDPAFDRMLRRAGRSRGEILPSGENLVVGLTSGCRWGGEQLDVMESLPEAPKQLAVEITRQAGLRVCGLDMLCEAGKDPEDPASYVLIEVNSSPGLWTTVRMGPEGDAAATRFLERALLAMQR